MHWDICVFRLRAVCNMFSILSSKTILAVLPVNPSRLSSDKYFTVWKISHANYIKNYNAKNCPLHTLENLNLTTAAIKKLKNAKLSFLYQPGRVVLTARFTMSDTSSKDSTATNLSGVDFDVPISVFHSHHFQRTNVPNELYQPQEEIIL